MDRPSSASSVALVGAGGDTDCQIEEDIIEGFAIASFETLDQLEAFSKVKSRKSSLHASLSVSCRRLDELQVRDAVEASSSATVTSHDDDDDDDAATAAATSCSPSSLTIVDLDATTEFDLDDVTSLQRPADDDDVSGGRQSETRSVVRVPSPSSWDTRRCSAISSPRLDYADLPPTHPPPDVKPTSDDVKAELDHRPAKKPCSCGIDQTYLTHKVDVANSSTECPVVISPASPVVNIKVEKTSDSPSLAQHHHQVLVNSSHILNSVSRGPPPSDACCQRGSVKLNKSKHSRSPSDYRRARSGSRSRSPFTTFSQSKVRTSQSRCSVDVKTECTSPAVHKKSSSSADRYTPPHRPRSTACVPPSSFPLFAPAAVPAASYFSAARPPYPGFDTASISNAFRGLTSHASLFAPQLHPSLMSSPLLMGLSGQFAASGQDPLLSANHDMLARMQQELNARFLHDRSLLPMSLPPVPFTLHTEMHQHQHLHHHQHVLPPGTYLPTPSAQSAASSQLFTPSKFATGNDLLLHSQNLAEFAERDRLAKFASLSGFPGLGMPQQQLPSMQFGHGLNPTGAFQPKAASAANLSGLNSASQLLLSMRDRDSLSARTSSLSALHHKKQGRWCAAHVDIAWKIQNMKQQQKKSLIDHSSTLRPTVDASKQLSAAHPFMLSTKPAAAGGGGGVDRRPSIHHAGDGAGLSYKPSHYSGRDGIHSSTFAPGLAQPGLDASSSLFAQRLLHAAGERRGAVSPPTAGRKLDVLHGDTRHHQSSAVHHHQTMSSSSSTRDNRNSSSSHRTVRRTSRSPDRNSARRPHRSRSRSPLSRRHPPTQPRVPDNVLRSADLGVPHDPSSLLHTGFFPGAFTSLLSQPRPPSAATIGSSASSLRLGHDAWKQMEDRERLSSLSSQLTSDALLRDRLLNDHHERMMLASAAAELNAVRPLRPPEPTVRPDLYAANADGLFGGVGSVFAAQSALLRPNLTVPPMKLPSAYGPIVDPNSLGSLNLPFR